MLKNSISYKIISINIFAERVDSTLFFFLRKSRLNSTEPKPNKPEATETLQDLISQKLLKCYKILKGKKMIQ